MYKVLLFGGTVEGRTVAEYLNENKIPSMVCVATEYGESLLPQGEYLELSHERLDEKQMEERMLQMENGLVIDATHPYAQVVTENIETACERTGTAYLRVVRQESRRLEEEETITYVKSIREAVEYLEKTSGNILVTTGITFILFKLSGLTWVYRFLCSNRDKPHSAFLNGSFNSAFFAIYRYPSLGYIPLFCAFC